MKKVTLRDIMTGFLIPGVMDPRFGKFHTDELSMQDHIDLLPPLVESQTDFSRYNTYKRYTGYLFSEIIAKGTLAPEFNFENGRRPGVHYV